MKRMVSGIKPSGNLTLGNYIGAMKQFVKLQDDFEMITFIADLHAITVDQDPKSMYENTQNLVALYLAIGLDPNKTLIFKQSDVAAHAEIGWVLQCQAYMGELNRMTQYKEKAVKNQATGVSGGLFAYPALMASDILLYSPDVVPVGEDQLQHLELTRTVAERFNAKFGETFTIPQSMTPKEGARIMSLQNPEKKMSKSESDPKGTILLLDDIASIRKKIMSAVTDSDTFVAYDKQNKPGVSNLLEIFSVLSNTPITTLVDTYRDSGYGTFKKAVADCVCAEIEQLQTRFHEIKQSGQVEKVLEQNKIKANQIAELKRNEVYQKLGFLK
ncbi:MAG: tryptophan--tRNA ligase [Culicoidibacterales bacterium]